MAFWGIQNPILSFTLSSEYVLVYLQTCEQREPSGWELHPKALMFGEHMRSDQVLSSPKEPIYDISGRLFITTRSPSNCHKVTPRGMSSAYLLLSAPGKYPTVQCFPDCSHEVH